MECKSGYIVSKTGEIHELIETLWNVNCHATSSAWEIALELIETLWNVNYSFGALAIISVN